MNSTNVVFAPKSVSKLIEKLAVCVDPIPDLICCEEGRV